MTLKTTPFQDITPQYDAFFVDIWGVVHDGVMPYPGVADSLNYLINTKKVIFLSNAPRPAEIIQRALQKHGINVKAEGILTSGDVVRTEIIKSEQGKKVFHIGADENQDILRDMPIDIVDDVKNADLIVLSAFIDDPEKDDKFDNILEEAQKLNIPLMCANPDTYVPNGSSIRRCSGIFAERYEKMGGIVHNYGKPYNKIFEAAWARSGCQKDKILMIGDTFETDILGARNFGIDVAMVLTGNGAKSFRNLEDLEDKYNVSPTWIIENL